MKLPLVQGSYMARSLIANAQRCVNLYAEQNTPDAVFPYTFYPRPGYFSLNDLGASAGAARCNYVASTGELYRVVGNTVYYVDSLWTHTALGTIGDGTAPVYMADNGLAVLIVDGTGNGYCIDLVGGAHTFGTVNDAAFYGADRVDYVDTYFILNRPGTNQFYISLSAVSFDNLTGTISPGQLYAAFDPLDIAAKAGWPDPISGLIVLRREIWLIGQKTTEIWFNSGATDFTFQEMPGVFVEHGCIAPYSIWKQDVSVYWLSQDKEGRTIVIEGTQYAAKRISTHAIENAFAGYAMVSDAVGGIYQIEGHVFYKLTFPTENKTWVYDIASGFWFEDVYTDIDGFENRSLGIFSANAYQTTVESHWQTGELVQIDLDAYTDLGQSIVRRRGFPHLMNDGNRSSYPSFIADISAGYATQQVLSAVVTVPGSGYTSVPTVSFSGGGGTGAAAVASIDLELQSVTMAAGGIGYTSAPSVSFLGGGGSGASGFATIANAVNTITVTSPGSGYTSVPAVSLTGGGGTGATATAELSNYVSAIAVTSAGSGYATAPIVTISGDGSGATATSALANGTVSALTLASSGSGYTTAPSVSISGGGGSGATATAALTGAGVSSVTVTSGGSFLASSGSIIFTGGGGSGAVATAYYTKNVYNISLTAAGSGYTTLPTVTISGGGGSGATAIASGFTGSNGLTGVIITRQGSGYITAPTISFSGGGGSGAAATATLGNSISHVVVTNPGSGYTSAPTVDFSVAGSGTLLSSTINAGSVGSITLTAAGSGYTSVPTVSFSGGGGSGAAATATISADVGSIAVTAPGSGYSAPPTVSLSGGGGSGAAATASTLGAIESVAIVNSGTGYTSAPTVSFSGGGGSGAAATATVSSRVVSVTVTSPGTGYSYAPAVVFSGGGGSGAAASASVAGGISGLTITNGGSGYVTPPDISFSGGGGTSAAGTATIGFVTPLINLRWSDTRGATWGNALEQSMGAQGKYYTQPQWNRLGYARDRVFEVFWSYPGPIALNGAWVEALAMSS